MANQAFNTLVAYLEGRTLKMKDIYTKSVMEGVIEKVEVDHNKITLIMNTNISRIGFVFNHGSFMEFIIDGCAMFNQRTHIELC